MTEDQRAANREMKRRERLMFTGVGAGIALILLSRGLDWFGPSGDGWSWLSTSLGVIAAAVMVTAVVRLVRWQRAEYWREHEGASGRNGGPPPPPHTPQR